MEIKVYRQGAVPHPKDGITTYSGEDGRPFINDLALMVTDGLGGSGAMRHQNVGKDLFDEEKIVKTLCKGVFDEWEDEAFAEYIRQSFGELYSLKDCYNSYSYCLKKSSYFGSRLVSIVLANEFSFHKEEYLRIFEEYAKAADEAEKRTLLDKIGEGVAEVIRNKVALLAENANLYRERETPGLKLFATTLCAAVYCEREDCVEAVYFTAGDSRPYVWTVDNGLQQVLADEEGSDGGMTNTINMTTPFHIRCDHFSFAKPCILFNCSDGCFDAAPFEDAPLGLEKTLLDLLKDSSSPEEYEEKLLNLFNSIITNDDSSTIAMKSFGYASFEEIVADANKRLEQIQREYFDEMPDLFDRWFDAAYKDLTDKLPGQLAALKERFWAVEGVRALAREHVAAHRYPPYDEEVKRIDENIDIAEADAREEKKRAEEIVKEDYYRFSLLLKKDGQEKEDRKTRKTREAVEKAEKNYEKKVARYEAELAAVRETQTAYTETIGRLLEQIETVGKPSELADFNDVSFDDFDKCLREEEAVVDFLKKVRNKKHPYVKEVIEARGRYVEKNKEAADANPEEFAVLLNLILQEKELDYGKTGLKEGTLESLQSNIEEYRSALARLEKADKKEKEELLDRSAKEYWDGAYADVIKEYTETPEADIPEDLRAEAEEVLKKSEKEAAALKEKAELQRSLFDKYSVGYSAYLPKEE